VVLMQRKTEKGVVVLLPLGRNSATVWGPEKRRTPPRMGTRSVSHHPSQPLPLNRGEGSGQ